MVGEANLWITKKSFENNKDDYFLQIARFQGDKNKNYLVYCRSGNRSGSSLEIMEELGFKEAYHISGGLSEWKSEGFPIVVD